MPSLPPSLRGAPARLAAVIALVAGAFGAGVLTGATALPGHHGPAGRTGTDLDAVRNELATKALGPISQDKLDRAAVQGMVDALHDPWAAYYDSDDYAAYLESLDGEYTGVGILVRQRPGGAVYVASVQGGSPATRAGVRRGAVVVAVEGRSTTGQSAGEVAQRLRGASGTRVSVTLRSHGHSRTVTLARTRLVSRDVVVDWLTPQVARITVTAFTRGVGREVRDAVARLDARRAGGIVVDLRGNPGGLLDEAVEAASAFLDGGPVVSYERRGAAAQVLDARGGGDTTTPLAVLVDGGTASAAEVLAGALQDRGRAVVVGTRTFGKGTVQQPVHLQDGSVAQMTVAHYRTPSGRSLDGVGLEPDVEAPPGSAAGVAQQRAVEVLSGLLADAGTGGRG